MFTSSLWGDLRSSIQEKRVVILWLVLLPILLFSDAAFGHAVAEGDKGYIQEITGVNVLPFIYLGAKHMVTKY